MQKSKMELAQTRIWHKKWHKKFHKKWAFFDKIIRHVPNCHFFSNFFYFFKIFSLCKNRKFYKKWHKTYFYQIFVNFIKSKTLIIRKVLTREKNKRFYEERGENDDCHLTFLFIFLCT